jgi:hypothetical protein
MRLHDARVEHRDADAAAVELRGVALEIAVSHVAGQRSGDGFEGARGTAGDAIRRHAGDVRRCASARTVGRAHLHGQGTQGRMDRMDRAAGAQHGRAKLRHGGIGRIADDDRLDVADTVQVAHPARFGLAGVGQAGDQIACDLRLRWQGRGLRMRHAGLRQDDDEGQRREQRRQDASTPALAGRNDERWVRFHGVPAEGVGTPGRARTRERRVPTSVI